jgi:hypothetical protein
VREREREIKRVSETMMKRDRKKCKRREINWVSEEKGINWVKEEEK